MEAGQRVMTSSTGKASSRQDAASVWAAGAGAAATGATAGASARGVKCSRSAVAATPSRTTAASASAQRGGAARGGGWAATGVIGRVAVRTGGPCGGVGMSRIVGAGAGAPTRNEVCRMAPGRTLRSAARAAAAEG